MKKALFIMILLILSFQLFAALSGYIVGSMRVKVSFENEDPVYCYISINGYDIELFKSIGIDDGKKMYKLQPMTDIMPYLSDKAEHREVASEIFSIPQKFSIVPESKLKKFSSFKSITKIEYIEWMEYKGCEAYGFLTIPDKDIEIMRNSNEIYYKKKLHGEFLSEFYYVRVNDNLPSWIFRLLLNYSYWDVYFNQYDEIGNEQFDQFYSHFVTMLNHPKNKDIFVEFHLNDYFQYLNNYISSYDDTNNKVIKFTFDKNELKALYSEAIIDNIVVFSKSFD